MPIQFTVYNFIMGNLVYEQAIKRSHLSATGLAIVWKISSWLTVWSNTFWNLKRKQSCYTDTQACHIDSLSIVLQKMHSDI